MQADQARVEGAIVAVKANDPSALHYLYARYGEGVSAYVESIVGSRFQGRLVGETTVGDRPAIIPEIEGEAYITGEHTFFVDSRDPFAHGFRL